MDLIINDKLTIPESAMSWSYARSSGPGGQNVNKVNSKATLRWTPPEDFLSAAAMARLRKLANRYLTEEGEIVIASEEYRDQPSNIERSRDKLRTLILTALVAPKRRIATKPSRGAKKRRLEDKKRLSDKKKGRREF